MLRPIRLFLTGLALFVAAAGVGVLVASHWGPERTRAVLELSLQQAMNRPVAVGEAHLYFGGGPLSWLQGVTLDARGIQAFPAGAADADAETRGEPDLVVDRLQAELDPVSLLSGQVEVRSVALDGVRAWIGGASGRPGNSQDLAINPPDPDAEPVVGWLETLAEAAEGILSGTATGNDVSIRDADLRIQGPALAAGEEPWVLHLRDVSGTGRLRTQGHRASVVMAGRLEDGGDAARIGIDLERDARGALRIDVDIVDLELGYAAPAVQALVPTAELSGRTDLKLSVQRPQAEVWHVAAHAEARECAGAVPRLGDGRSVPVELAALRAGIELDLDPEKLRVSRAFVSAEETEITLDGEIERPLSVTSHTVGRFGLDHYDVARRNDLIAFLPPRQIATLNSALAPLRSGRVKDIHVEGEAPLADWLRGFDDDVDGLVPETVTARARFAGFAVKAGDGDTLTDLSGKVFWSGDRLELRNVRGRRAGHWMPVLDATLKGLSHLAGNSGTREIPDAKDAPLMLGLGPMYNIVVDPNRPPGDMPDALLLDLDHVVHPTLVWPLRNLFARAIPSADGIRLLLEHAVWGRVPIRAEGIWSLQETGPRKVERVVVTIQAKPPISGLEPIDMADPVWAKGRWHLGSHTLGDWDVTTSTGAFEATGQDVQLTEFDFDLGIAGRAVGHSSIDFSGGEELPYRTYVRIVDADAPGVVDKIGFEPHEATGTVNIEANLHGELRPGRKVMAGMEGDVQVQARDGAILKRLPAALAVAKVTDTFNPFGSRNEMRYSEIDANLRLDRGTVHADELRISGRDLRLLANGQVDALDPNHPVEAVVGIFFFKALDRVIGVVPLLSDLILGEDDNLMGAYVQLTGPWENPDAGLVPLKTMTSGPASFALEGVPRFVKRAIGALQGAFSRPQVAAPPPDLGEDS